MAHLGPARRSVLTLSDACLTICDMGRKQVQARAQSVGFLLVPGFALMSYAAAVEPLRAANLISGKPLYRWWHAAPGGKPVMASNGLAIIPDIGTGSDRDVDMLFVCLAPQARAARRHHRRHLRRTVHSRPRRPSR